MTAMNTPKKRAFIYPNINIKTSTFSIYLAVKMMGIHDANNQNATNKKSLFRILCKYLFSEVAVQAVTELDNKAAHCHTPVPQWHRPFL